MKTKKELLACKLSAEKACNKARTAYFKSKEAYIGARNADFEVYDKARKACYDAAEAYEKAGKACYEAEKACDFESE